MSDARRVLASAELAIDLDLLVANYRRVAAEAARSGSSVAAMVKADGYGLGASRVSAALLGAGCRTFFVANVVEGVELRHALRSEGFVTAGTAEPTILVLNGAHPGTEADLMDHELVPVVNSLEQIDRWSGVAPHGVRLPAALHVDTGMHRLGLMRSEFETLLTEPERLRRLSVELLMSHLASADERTSEQNPTQRQRFASISARFARGPSGDGGRAARSLANSSGLFLGPDYHFDLLRPGYCLYGGNPTPDQPNPMQPVVTLEVPIVQVRSVERGDSVGYGATYTATTPRRLATLAVGYADGFLRSSSGRGRVFVAGHPAPIVGRISMDLLTVDVTDVPDRLLWLGAPVELIGPHRPVDAVAADAGTIGYEVLVDLGRRYSRRYVSVGVDG